VLAALSELTPRQRCALTLRYVHGLTEPEIATALGCRPGTAASLLSRGRAALSRDDRLQQLVDTHIPEGAS
jgi:RNA polymerase sigma factor (sigma-70 family)